MQSFTLVAFGLCLAMVGSVAQKPHHCKAPPLLVGRLSLVSPKGGITVYERFSYDALGRRVRARAVEHYQNETFFQDVLLLFREGVYLEISYRNQTCVKKELKAPFQPIEIPRDATFVDQVILGSSSAPGAGLLVNTWGGTVNETQGKYFTTFTQFDCLPISSLYYSDATGWILTSFFDIVIGIEDPEEFIPPPFCHKRPTEDDPAADFFSALI